MDYAKTSLGTPFFLSPEICNGEKYNYKTDIWMVGCVIYELCTLKKPFTGDNLLILMTNIVKEKVAPIPSNYSDDLKNIVMLLMTKDPEDRPFIREILEIECVHKKMIELGIEDIESPLYSNKNIDYNSNKSFGLQMIEAGSPDQKVKSAKNDFAEISLDSNKKNSEKILESSVSNQNLINNNNEIMISTTNKGMKNSNSISMLNMGSKNNSQIIGNSGEKMRRKVRVPDKINKKYDSMGQQAFGKVMDDMSLAGFGETINK